MRQINIPLGNIVQYFKRLRLRTDMMEGEKGLLRDTRSSFLLFSRPVKMQNLNPVNCKFFAFRDTQTLTLNLLE